MMIKALKLILAICSMTLLSSLQIASAQIIEVKSPGNLTQEIYSRGLMDANDLTVRGMIDDRDLMTIRRMIYLSYLDLSQTNLRTVPSSAFASMRNLSTVRLSSDLKKIGRSAFESCMLISTFNIPDRVTEIGASAFYNCKGLLDIEIPRSVEKIGGEAFMGCLSMSKVFIEGSPIIEDHAFLGCDALMLVVCQSTTPPDVALNAFEGTPANKQLGVPAEAVDAYREHAVWGKVFNQILPATER